MDPRQTRVIHNIKNALNDIGVERGTGVLIGASAGPDSTALLFALRAVSKEYDLSLHAAYLDHGLRAAPEIENEIDFLKRTTSALGIGLTVGRILQGEIVARAKELKQSVEEYARTRRYEFFDSVRKDIASVDYIATGHTLDDTVETVVMRFFQGSDLSGLSGIPLKNGAIIRPLSYCRKKDLLEYLESIGSDYRIDSSNIEGNYLRNRTRNILLPVVRDIFPGFEKNIIGTLQKAMFLDQYVKTESEKTPHWEKSDSGFRIQYAAFISIPPYLRLFSFLRMYDTLFAVNLQKKAGRLPFRFISRLMSLDGSEKNGPMFRGHGIELEKRGEWLFCDTDIVANGKKGYLITIEKKKKIALHSVKKTIEYISEDKKKDNLQSALFFGEDEVFEPIIVRSKRPGDCIVTRGETRILKKIFNEWKVPARDRWKIPVVCDRNCILAVFGKPFGYKNLHVDYVSDTRTEAHAGKKTQNVLIIND